MTQLEEKITDAILKDIGNDDEGTFFIEIEEGNIHYEVKGSFVTEGHMAGGDRYTPGIWVVTYAKAAVEIDADDMDGNIIPHNLNETAIETEIESALSYNPYH